MSTLKSIPRALYRAPRTLPDDLEQRRFRTRMRSDPSAPELVLSPHLDDAVLDCWGLLAGERPVSVVNVFAGVPPGGHVTLWDAITGAQDSAARAHERLEEDARALARASRTAHNLAHLDAQYRARFARPRLRELDVALVEILPRVSRVHVPAGIGGHPDHRFLRRYGRMLRRDGIPVSLYAELPYCVLHGWPPWVDGREPEANRDVDAFWLSQLDGVPEMPSLRSARVERLDDGAASAKLAAMRCYATQLPCLEYGARQLLADPEIHRFEVHWELLAGARA
ncbi:MAG TPA: PIG-L family deacetylase [Solirubrobacteraceae bacterium]